MNTDGNTAAIEGMMADREEFDERREAEQELQDLRDEVDALAAKLAEVEAMNKNQTAMLRQADKRGDDWKARAEAAEADLTASRAALVTADKLAHDLQDLINNSAGVVGLHMNGDLAEWDTLTAGGDFEAWLRSLSEYAAIRALATPQEKADE